MKGKINKGGLLSIERVGKLKDQICIFDSDPLTGSAHCGDWCPLFGEPTVVPSGFFPEKIFLLICDGSALEFTELRDERHDDKIDPWRLKVGDIVTRIGTDEQEILEINEGGDLILVKCIKAPHDGFCKVGDTESNVPWRYRLVRSR